MLLPAVPAAAACLHKLQTQAPEQIEFFCCSRGGIQAASDVQKHLHEVWCHRFCRLVMSDTHTTAGYMSE